MADSPVEAARASVEPASLMRALWCVECRQPESACYIYRGESLCAPCFSARRALLTDSEPWQRPEPGDV